MWNNYFETLKELGFEVEYEENNNKASVTHACSSSFYACMTLPLDESDYHMLLDRLHEDIKLRVVI